MDIGNVLLSPRGRIGPRDFLRGLVLLTGASVIVQVLALGTSMGVGVLQYPLLWGYLCVFGKRLHDAGQTAWLTLAFLVGYMIAATLVSSLLLPILSPQVMPLMKEIEAFSAKGDLAGMFKLQQQHAIELARGMALTTLASFLICSAGLGFAGASLPSDPKPNAHGPATGPRDAA